MTDSLAHEEFESQAALYALGALEEDEAREFAESLAGEDAAHRLVAESFARVSSALGYAAPEVAPPARLREKLLSLVKAERENGNGAADEKGDSTNETSSSNELSAARTLTIRLEDGGWGAVAPGVLMKNLFFDKWAKTATVLVKMSPGASLPKHRHHGIEQCIVLEGDLSAAGETLGAGDFQCALSESVHDEISTKGGALFMLVTPLRHHGVEYLR